MYIGIDTSCYTTSVAAVNERGVIIKDCRRILHVVEGERGLQQSKAVWQHVNNLPELVEDLFSHLDRKQLKAIAVSEKPRPVKDSYMPVFMAGYSHAKTIAASLGIPLYLTTHQEGHIMAGCSDELLAKDKFLALHLSGGTSELLRITNRAKPFGFDEELLGKSLDLHAGQFIDRIGVALGLPFPCGPALEVMANNVTTQEITIPSVVRSLDFSFSGPESAVQRLIKSGSDHHQIARATEQCIVNTLRKVLEKAVAVTKINHILIVGGVSANAYIRQQLVKKLASKKAKLYFAEPKLSSDNGVGVALIGRRFYLHS
ncbi:MAG: O-sialoglycoprotein endopeptidase [Bacillota bacterium]|nr:O-sialoglycoprotein endopeptidase [Bacillota bacterium]